MQTFVVSFDVVLIIGDRFVSVRTVEAFDDVIRVRMKEEHNGASTVLSHFFAVRYHHAMQLYIQHGATFSTPAFSAPPSVGLPRKYHVASEVTT